jgi:hypothetical protein
MFDQIGLAFQHAPTNLLQYTQIMAGFNLIRDNSEHNRHSDAVASDRRWCGYLRPLLKQRKFGDRKLLNTAFGKFQKSVHDDPTALGNFVCDGARNKIP